MKYFLALILLLPSVALAAISPADIISQTNSYRREHKVAALSRGPLLSHIAQLKADHMARLGYFSHEAPQAPYRFTDWLDLFDYPGSFLGENLAHGYTTAAGAIKGWQSSEGHDANLLSADYDKVGVGISEGYLNGVKTTFIVQLFAKLVSR